MRYTDLGYEMNEQAKSEKGDTCWHQDIYKHYSQIAANTKTDPDYRMNERAKS